MGYETYSGIVAREVDTGEADRYLTLLTTERGKLECYAKGIRKQNSKLASQAGLLSYGEFQLFNKGDRLILTSAKSAESFYSIRTDVYKCAYAAHFLEIARDVVVEAQAFPEALQLLLNSLYVLCYKNFSPEFIARVYEIRILSLAGFAPLTDRCSVCGSSAASGPGTDGDWTGAFFFAVDGDGVVCGRSECKAAAGRAFRVSPGTLRAIRHVVACGAGEIYNFQINDAVSGELASLIPAYLGSKFGREYTKPGEAERYRAFENDMRDRLKRRTAGAKG